MIINREEEKEKKMKGPRGEDVERKEKALYKAL